MASISKFLLYESSVQDPKWHVEYLPRFHRTLVGKNPLSMREDFCGSGRISCEWVKLSRKNKAVGIDIDPRPLRYANKINKGTLTKDECSRLKFINQNVLKSTQEKFDLVGSYNFSFFALHEREEMLQYAKAVYRSLKLPGTFFLDIAGGPGFLKTRQNNQKITIPGHGTFRQIWEQSDYNPITSINQYSIHFMLLNGKCLNDAFVYRWRIWQIRELREILAEAGFKKSLVLWEKNKKTNEGSGEFYPTENAENAYTWVAYVIGVKKA